MINVDYIIPAINGGMCNNMFMIANAYCKALEFNKQLVVARPQLIYHGYNYGENIFRKVELIDRFIDNGNHNRPIPSDDKHTIYIGYFQSENYFKKYSENVKSLFSAPLDFIERIRTEIPVIFEKKVTVINVRRGDYLHSPNYHPTLSPEYIMEAIKHVSNEYYLIASDDIPWCKNNIHLENSIYLEGYKTYEQLWILSMCHNFIISNSSFSWWAAYLSRDPNKKVIAPETWFGPEYHTSWDDMYCSDWTILPTYFNNGLILPK